MDRLLEKRTRLKRRITRVKYAIRSRNKKPRLVFKRSNRYLSAQIIDDEKGVTLCSVNTAGKNYQGDKGKNKEAAAKLGETLAKKAAELGIKKVVLDRRGILYHGKIVSFADAARENGLEF